MKRRDLTGQRFGRLIVRKYAFTRSRKSYWLCLCRCGKKTMVSTSNLRTGHIRSCGCMKMKDMTGRRFGKLKVIKKSFSKESVYWNCVCDCGKKTVVIGSSLRFGRTKSCGSALCNWTKARRHRTSILHKGMRHTDAARKKMHANHPYLGKRRDEVPSWKGKRVGYHGLHKWIASIMGKPERCSMCGTTDPKKKYQWANISGRYLRDVNDFMRVCRSCHAKYDYKRPQPKGHINRAAKQAREMLVTGGYHVRRG